MASKSSQTSAKSKLENALGGASALVPPGASLGVAASIASDAATRGDARGRASDLASPRAARV